MRSSNLIRKRQERVKLKGLDAVAARTGPPIPQLDKLLFAEVVREIAKPLITASVRQWLEANKPPPVHPK